MSLPVRFFSLAAPLAALTLAGCAQPFSANVARFQALPPPSGQTFTIQPAPGLSDGLEFATYASQVAADLQRVGYQPSQSPTAATLVVTIGYGVDRGHQQITTYPGVGGPWGPWGYGYGFGRFGYGRLGYRHFGGGPFLWGWNDPFFDDGGWGPDVESYTVYTSRLDMTIRRTADGQSLFEGHAQAHSVDNSLPHLVPNLITAMFTNFPGQSGETVRITIPPSGQAQARRS